MHVKSLVAMGCLFVAQAAGAALVSIVQNDGGVHADNAVGPISQTTYSVTAIPGSAIFTATDGGSSATTRIDHSDDPGQTILKHSFAQTREAAPGSWSDAWSMTDFLASDEASFQISGTYAADDLGQAGVFGLYVILVDQTNNATIFYSYQESRNTADERLTVGGAEADTINEGAGSTSGMLVAGHTYRFYYSLHSNAIFGSSAATASGDVTLSIGPADVDTVPEPASVHLLLLAAGVGALSRGWAARHPVRMSRDREDRVCRLHGSRARGPRQQGLHPGSSSSKCDSSTVARALRRLPVAQLWSLR
jgi:hypothetical protein